MNHSLPCALTIAGSDSGGNAGIQADLLSFAANGVFGTSAITCLTSQNPTGVRSIHASSPEVVRDQIEQVCDYYQPAAAKTGMLLNLEIIQSVVSTLSNYPNLELVIDPVMVSSSGDMLLEDSTVSTIKNKLLPASSLITPNLDEAEVLYESRIRSVGEMKIAAEELSKQFNTAVLIKGGHLTGDTLTDILAAPNIETHRFTQNRIHGIDTHGSGCTLSAAITAQLALGADILQAVIVGRNYLRTGMKQALAFPNKKFINHFPK